MNLLALLVDVPEKPSHPPFDYAFPTRQFGRIKASFRPSWCSRWKWLHYDNVKDLAYCHVCLVALKSGLLRSNEHVYDSFVIGGYADWRRKTGSGMKCHELSEIHRYSLEKRSISFEKVFGHSLNVETEDETLHTELTQKTREGSLQPQINDELEQQCHEIEWLRNDNEKSASEKEQDRCPLLDNIPENPCQPCKLSRDADDLRQIYKSSFSTSWFKRWKWLHYDIEKKALFCHWCIVAHKSGILTLKRVSQLTHYGLRNCKYPPSSLKYHEKTVYHRQAKERRAECFHKVFGRFPLENEDTEEKDLRGSFGEDVKQVENGCTFTVEGLLIEIPEKPHQPSDFKFPKREFGSKCSKRSFNKDWFKRWDWLHYDAKNDLAFCHCCVLAHKSGLLTPTRSTTLNALGYCQWISAMGAFPEHEISNFHKQTVVVYQNCLEKVFGKGSTDEKARKTENKCMPSEVEALLSNLSPGLLEFDVVKVLVVGDEGCGKRTLLNQFYSTNFEDFLVNISLNSISGMENDDQRRVQFYSNTDVIIMMFSYDHPNSSVNIVEKWFPEIRHYFPKSPIILVCNKIDLLVDNSSGDGDNFNGGENFQLKEIVHDLGEKLCAYTSMNCSAKFNTGVFDVFKAAADAYLSKKES